MDHTCECTCGQAAAAEARATPSPSGSVADRRATAKDRLALVRRAVTRRGVLAGTAATAALALGACGDADPGPTGGTSSPTADASPTAEDSPSTDPDGSASPSDAPTGERIAGVEDFPVGGGDIVTTGAGQVVITRPAAAEYAAFSARCPHQGCTVSEVSGNTITCACHGSTFDGSTGARLAGPAQRGLDAVAIRVDGGAIHLA